MSKRALCEIVTDEFTGIEYSTPYSGNCYFTSDSAGLQEFKREVLAKRPDLKGKLKILSVAAMEKKRNAALEARENDRGYQEWKAYRMSTGAVFI